MPDPTTPLRVAVIGAGMMANRVHYPSLASFDDVDVVAACDISEAALTGTADKWNIPGRYSDYRKMLDECGPLDAVYAIGQPHHLFDVWLDCLGRGLNLYIEKPLGMTLHQAQILVHAAQQSGVITQVGFQRRNCPLAVLLRDKCLEKGGPIVHAVCTFYKCEPNKPYARPRDHMMDDGTHAIDTLRWACGGGEIVGIDSIAKNVGVPDLNFFAALLRFDNGATGVLLNSWSSGRRIFRLELHSNGVCAELDLEDTGTLYAKGDTKGETFDTKAVAQSDEFFVFGGFQAKSREFIDAVRTKTSSPGAGQPGAGQPSSHFGDALKTMEAASRILAKHELKG